MRRRFDGRVALGLSLNLAAAAQALGCGSGCARNEEPAPSTSSGTAATAGPSGSSSPSMPPMARTRPTAAPVDSSMLPRASRDVDWGLDVADAARDYVVRYLHASNRYAAQTACVVVKPSVFNGDRSVVEARNDPSGACGAADELRDRFFVTVATDRMSLDPSLHQPKLQPWPDGSDTDGPAAKVADIQDLHKWKAGFRDTFHKLLLAPLRVHLYGRGTYPVVTIAGWHGPVERSMTSEQLEAPAKALCDANDGGSLGIFAGVDRTTLLRIVCPHTARFESL